MDPVAKVCLRCVIQYTSASRYRVRSKSQLKGQFLHIVWDPSCGMLWLGHDEKTFPRTTELRFEAPLRPEYSDPIVIL